MGGEYIMATRRMVLANLQRKWKSLSRVWLFATPWTVATRLLCPWNSPGKNTGVGCCHFFLQGIFLTQRSNLDLLCLLHCRGILYHWSHQGSLENMEETKRNSTAVIAYKVTLIWDALPPWPTACRYGSKFLGQWSLPKAGPSGCVRPPSRPCRAPRKAT